ncbi:uncharacterized protein LOC117111097 [Anneissia japonica]|uniref:uncharacterized protein LOC117111097 n=1 Tax=Anneissia japonica TaxID=1529436 RepID=UPI0014256220|nr:uncharacterized protein LOC117111097 [Anneissia japonica]
MDRTHYINEASWQLRNTDFYAALNDDPTKKYHNELKQLIQSFPPDIRKQLSTTIPAESCPGTFYMLPNIHKPGNPVRPIVSSIGTLTGLVSGFVDDVLKTFATSTPSYLQDTTDFLNKLSQFSNLLDNTILVTMDVASLYTNIPHEDGIQAIKNILPDNLLTAATTELARFVLAHNYFEFNNSLYKQICGTAMGTCMAPQYANLFMANLEQNFLAHSSSPLVYYRYIDDIFMIWTDTLAELEFHRGLNNAHPTIKLTIEHSNEEVHFLDTTVSFRENQNFNISQTHRQVQLS